MGNRPDPFPRRDGVAERRASDADRERAVTALREAAADGRIDVGELDDRTSGALAARTVADLERVTGDLGPATASLVRVDPTDSGTRSVISVMGGTDRRGRWRVGAGCRVLCLMGGAELDLRDAELASPDTTISVVTLMGGAELRLPAGVDVRVSRLAFMGGHDVRLSADPPPAGAPIVRLRLRSLMGGVKVRQDGAPSNRKRIGPEAR